MAALGSLVVKLALEYAQFTGGLDKSEQAALQASKRIQDTFDGLKGRVVTTAAAIAGGLAAGFTLSAFKSLITSVAESNAALGDLALTTGSTTEALSGLAAVGKFTDTSAQAIGAAMNKLTNNLASATEESKGTALAVQALGIDFETFRKMSPEQQMQAVAKAMGGFAEGSGKAAIAMALYGKEGAKMLPFLKDLGDVGELQAKVTTEQSDAADNFGRNLTRLQASGEAWKKELANGMIPAIDLGTQALVDVMNGAGGLRAEVRRLADDGSIARWTKSAITGLTYVADAVQYVVRAVKVAGESIGAYAAAGVAYFGGIGSAIKQVLAGDFTGAVASMKSGMDSSKTIISGLGESIISTFGEDTLGSKIRARMGEIEATGNAGEAAKPKLNFSNVLDDNKKSADGASDALAALIEQLRGLDRLQTAQAKETTADLQSLRKRGALSDIDAIERVAAAEIESLATSKSLLQQELAIYETKKNGKKDMAATQAKIAEQDTKIAGREKQLGRDLAETYATLSAAADKRVDARIRDTGALEKQLRELQFENTTIGKTAAQVRALDMARSEEMATALEREAVTRRALDGNNAEAEQLERQAELLRQIAGQKGANEARQSWFGFWESVDSTAHDTFVNVGNEGMSAFKRIGTTLKSAVLDVLYQMTIKKWFFNIAASVTGTGANIASAAGMDGGYGSGGAGGMMNIASGLSSASGLYAAGSYFASGFTGTMMGSAAGMGMTLPGAATGVGAMVGGTGATGLMGSAGSALGAMGPVGWIALAALAAYAIFSDKDPASVSTGDTRANYDKFGNKTSSDNRFGFQSEQTTSLTDALQKSYMGMAASLGIGTVDTNFGVGGNSDGKVSHFGIGANAGGLNYTSADNLEYSEAAYELEASRAIMTALKGSELPHYLTGVFDNITASSATQEQVNSVLAYAQALKGFNDQLLQLPFSGLADLSYAATQGLIGAAGGLDKLGASIASYYDNFYSEAEKTANSSRQIAEALAEVNLALPQTRKEFKAQMDAAIALGDAGAPVVAVLLGVSAAFVEITPALKGLGADLQTSFESIGQMSGDLSQIILDGINNSDPAGAGQFFADTLIYGVQSALYQGFADQVTGIITDQLVSPMVTALATGASISEAISGAAIDSMVAQANAAAAALNAILSDATFQDALSQISGAVSSVVSGAIGQVQRPAYSAPSYRGASSYSGGGGGGSGGGASAADSIKSAWQAITDSVWGEVKRIRGLLEGTGAEGYAMAQARFAIATAQARADDQEAYKALPGLSQAMLALAENNASTLLELQRIRGQTAASLSDTASMVSGKYGLSVPSFDVGTNYVQRDMLAMIHEGEEITPRAYNPAAGGRRPGGGDAEMANALRRMADRLDAIEANTRAGAQHGGKTARLIERAMPDGDAIQMRETPKLGVPA